MEDTHDIRSLVKNYTIVPGLVLATIGGYAAFMGAFSMLWNKWLYWVLFRNDQNSWLANLGVLASLLLPIALYTVVVYSVMRYYKRRFGEARPHPEETRKLTTELIWAFVGYFFIGQLFDTRLHSAVSVTLLVFAVFLLAHWWIFARAQIHYPVLAAIAVVLSLVPLFNSVVYSWLYATDTSPDWYGFNIAICSGLLLLLAGLLDHWYMVRTFARIRSNVFARSSDAVASKNVKAVAQEL